MPKILRIAAVVLVLATLGACKGATVSREEHLKRGDQYMANKEYRNAILEYRAAVAANKMDGPAHQKLGEAFLMTREYVNAFRQYVLAADLMPDDMQAQLKAGHVLLLVNSFEDAKARAEKVLEKEPQNADAHILLGNALSKLKDIDKAMDEVRQAIAVDPARSAGYSNLGAIQAASGDLEQSEASFKKAVAAEPKALAPRLAIANLYWAMGKSAEAEVQIKEAVKIAPDDPVANQALAMLYLGTKRMAEAEAPLKVVVANSPGTDARIMLADYYANSRRLPEAKKLYEEVASGTEAVVKAKLRLASLGLYSGDKKSAYEMVDGILAKEPHNTDALVAKGQLLFMDGKSAEALTSIRAAISADPKAPLPQYIAGLILKSQDQYDEAAAAFKAALGLSSGFAPPNAELARLAIQAGKFQDAVQYARAAIGQAPTYGEAYLLLARAYVSMGNLSAAEDPIKVMVAHFPDEPAVQAELGRFLLMRNDLARSATAFEAALARDPLNVPALEGMVALDLRQQRTAAARKRLDDAVAKAPNNAKLQIMAARLYFQSFHDLTAAEASVQHTLAADPNNIEAFSLMAQVYLQAKNLPAATKKLEELTERQPRSVGNHTSLGVLYYLQGRLDLAQKSYQRALDLDPKAPVAANNLAQMYLDRNGNLDAALQLAQAAKAGLPGSHEVADTLGWIYYKKGMAPQAVTSLKQAVAAEPANAVYLYHLGAAYALSKDKANARMALEKALKLQPTFPGSDDARKILENLNG